MPHAVSAARLPRLLVGALAACTFLTVTGCKDEAAQARADLQEKIRTATQEIESASVLAQAGGESLDKARSTFQRVASEMGNVRDGAAGQKEAAAMLASSANQHLAMLDLAAAESVAAQHAAMLGVLHSCVDAALRLDGVIAGRAGGTLNDQRSALNQARGAFERERSEYTAMVAELDGPIAERETLNQRDAAAAADLDSRASSLYGNAERAGYAAGFPDFERAKRLEREADGHRRQIADRENELRYNYEPDHTYWSGRESDIAMMLGAVREAIDALDSHEAAGEAQADELRSRIRNFANTIDDELDRMQAEMTTEIDERITEAATRLERAATLAAQGGRGSGGNAAQLAAARAHAMLARAYTARAAAAGDLADLLTRLAEAGDALPGLDSHAAAASSLSAVRDQAIADARAAYESAKTSASSAGAGGQRLATSIDAALAVLN